MKNSWYSRIAAGLLGLGVSLLHGELSADVQNTDFGMFLYHWSAGCAEFLLIAMAPFFLDGKLCDRIQISCAASIIANGLGWLAYLAYAPPVFYDTVILGISCGQIIILFMGGKHVDYSRLMGECLLRGSSLRRPQLNFEKTKR